MALIKCKECGNKMSDKAEFCPNCGCPIEEMQNFDTDNRNDNNPQPSKKGKGWIITVFVIIVSCAIGGVWWNLNSRNPTTSDAEITSGFINMLHQFDELYPFSEGLALVKKDNKFGYINTKGELVIPCQFGYASDFIDGAAIAAVDSEMPLYILKSDGQITETKYIFYSPTAMGTIGTYCSYLKKESTHSYKNIYSFESLNSEGKEVTMFINKDLQKVDKPTNISPRVFEKDNMYTVYTSTEKSIYGDDVELKGLKSNDGKIVIHAKYNYLELGDNGVALASIFVEDAESHQHQYEPHGLTVYGYIDMDGNSTFTDTDLKKIEAYKQEQLIKKEYLERIAAEEQRRLEEEQQKGPEWIHGVWECHEMIDMGMFGRQRANARLCIDRDAQMISSNNDGMRYNGRYSISDNEIHFGDNYACLDNIKERIEFGDGVYYHKASDSYSYGGYSNSGVLESSYKNNKQRTTFRTPSDVLTYTSENSFYNDGDRLKINFNAAYLNDRALTGAPRVTNISGSTATIVANSPYGGGGALHFYVNASNGTIMQNGDVYRLK